MNYIIAFSGKAQSGKNTAATVLRNRLEKETTYDIFEESFAEKLKEIAEDLFFWRGDKTSHPDDVKDKGRNLLISIGNKMREIRPTVWVEYVLEQIRFSIVEDTLDGDRKIFFITDLRYQNEARLLQSFPQDYNLKDVKVILIRIDRDQSLHIDNISETDLDQYNFNYRLINNGTLPELEENLAEIMKKEGIL